MQGLLPATSSRVDTTEVFTELLYRIRAGKYSLSAEEAGALKKCENDLQVLTHPISSFLPLSAFCHAPHLVVLYMLQRVVQ
jgi:hypothetical protein